LVLETFFIETVGSAQVVLLFLEAREAFFLVVVFFLYDVTLRVVILALPFFRQNEVFDGAKVKSDQGLFFRLLPAS
jgi:hypothetical protein